MRSIVWTLLLVGSTASAEPVLLYAPWSRPTVPVAIGHEVYTMLLDTGSHEHVWSLKQARAAHVTLGKSTPGLDVDMRSYEHFPVDVRAQIIGGSWPAVPLTASEWTDVLAEWRPGGPRNDGVLSPQKLAVAGRAVVLDLRAGELDDETWPQAQARLAKLPRLLADVVAVPSGHFIVAARVSGREVRLVVDTGAPESMLYEPRGDDVPEGGVRIASHPHRIEVGAVRRSVVVQMREPTAEPGFFDGLLGMDILRDCALAMDATRMLVRCAEVADMGAPAGDLSLNPKHVQIGAGGPWLEERVAGGYHYDGDGFEADVARDGSVEFHRLRGRVLAMRTEREEREWFMDATADVRHEMSRSESLRTSFDRLPRLLAWVWGSWSHPEAREILFRIWDEAAESDDPELGSAGEHARKMIERFVRRELPAGSPDHFTDEELQRFNGRRARGPRFDPYHQKNDRGVAMAD
jgi:hypothetical protein